MRISRIYTHQLLDSDTLVTLDEKASHYLTKVLRHQPGDELILFNGDGSQYDAAISSIEKRAVVVAVGEKFSPVTESPLRIHLGIGMSKGDRMDWVLQKATELGVTALTPLLTERTEFKLKGDRQEKKLEHWRQIVISACEQCGRNTLPLLHDPITLSQWLEHVEADLKLVLHHRSEVTLPRQMAMASVALLIGPEGGLSEPEITGAQQSGFAPWTLGPRVMRTETAPLAAIAILQSVWGDF